MKKKSIMKVSRGRLEDDKQKSEDSYEYLRVLRIMIPLIMIAILVVGIYFGYLSYKDNFVNLRNSDTLVASTEPEYSDEEKAYLLKIVNSGRPVDESFVPELSEYNGVQVSTLMVEDLENMLSDAKEAGMNIEVTSGYISYEEQSDVYNKAVKDYKKKKKCSTVKAEAAIKKTTPNAGESEQQTGLIVELTADTKGKFKNSTEFSWLMKNSVNYGFILRYPDKENTGGLSYSPNLFRYVGEENAFSMRAYNMNLDEYVQYLNAQ